jgi:dCTP deaminase
MSDENNDVGISLELLGEENALSPLKMREYNYPGILPDSEIRRMCFPFNDNEKPLLTPFAERTSVNDKGARIPSYGISSMGYDIRLAPEWKLFDRPEEGTIDILNPQPGRYVTESSGEWIIIPPGTTVLSRSVEYFNLPNDVFGICTGKSTLARLGLDVLVSPLEPGWSGHLVVEIANNTPNPIRMYADIGVSQLVFFRSRYAPDKAYTGGKYDKQEGITESLL